MKDLNKIEIVSSKSASFISGKQSDNTYARFFFSPAGRISSQVFDSSETQTAWYDFVTKTNESTTYGGILTGEVDFSSQELFGPAGTIKIWQTSLITSQSYAPEYHDYGLLTCIHTANYYQQILQTGSISGVVYRKFAMSLDGLKAANWYKYAGMISNKV